MTLIYTREDGTLFFIYFIYFVCLSVSVDVFIYGNNFCNICNKLFLMISVAVTSYWKFSLQSQSQTNAQKT